jgi:Holliday junction resolvasome RuvABC endonuclease subunit
LKKFGTPLTGPVYVGIDQSYSGFAVTSVNDSGYYTTVYRSDLRGIERLADIRSHLRLMLDSCEIRDIAMEGYAFGSQMANMLGELGGMVKLELYDLSKYPLIVPPTVLKKYVAGKGQGVSKSQMLLNVYKHWGVEFNDDNAADSFALAKIASGEVKFAYQQDVISKLQDPKFREK